MAGFTKAVVSHPARRRMARAPFGGKVTIHATAEETGGAFGSWETVVPPGGGPAPHLHTRETEVFRVLSGTFRFRCGTDVFDAPEGTVVTLPPHVEHGWTNVGDGEGRVFGVVSPGGFERLFLLIEETGARTEEEIARIEAALGIVNSATRALAQGKN
jgi:mannose-6-phosphate isomerase-like protein (cupin superfamily)